MAPDTRTQRAAALGIRACHRLGFGTAFNLQGVAARHGCRGTSLIRSRALLGALQQANTYSPTVVLEGAAAPCEQGTPVTTPHQLEASERVGRREAMRNDAREMR